MSNMSVSQIRLLSRGHKLWSNDKLARKLLLRVLDKLAVGSLTIYEGTESIRLGQAKDAAGPHAEVQVHHPRAYARILAGGTIAAGEAYLEGDWTASDLLSVTRLFCANMATMEAMEERQNWLVKLGLKLAHSLNRNTWVGSRRNISAHYDLGNEFFSLFLDRSMMYSSAIFQDPATPLEVAAEAKLDEICRQLELCSGDHLLEIGTGWGGMAIHAARHYGCRVTTTTISQEQYQYALDRVRELGLEQQITVLCKDYRELEGRYDKLVSIEMIEAVGHEFYQNYFQRCSDLLRDDGKMLIQAITISDQRYQQARDSVDFIKRYIFPGGCLPSLAVIGDHVARDTDMQVVHLRDITPDYATTLACWRERFIEQLDAVREQGFDERFIRMWEYYLCYCEGGFRERVIGTVQLALAKPGYRFPG